MNRPLFQTNAQGDVWQPLELFDQADLVAAGGRNLTTAPFVAEHLRAMADHDEEGA